MLNKLTSILLLVLLTMPQVFGEEIKLNAIEEQVLSFGANKNCKNPKESDIPTIFIPGILASWYSEESYNKTKIKRWIPDPITHSYDTLFNTFKQNGYSIKDVFYLDEFNTYTIGNPKQSLYLFGYDWKKDNKLTAKLLSNLVLQIREKYEEQNGCDIGTVNIIAHSMGGLVARAMLQNMCVDSSVLKTYYDRKGLKEGELKDFISKKCYNFTKINKFVTISTPHRGSPNSLPMWERGDILQTEAFIKGNLLMRQLGIKSKDNFYKLIHGYNDKVPNGIVTIGQLLPDISKNSDNNKELLYLEQKGKKLSNTNHPKNSFLEELNREESIEKMFKSIGGKYSLYYSSLTENKDKNNVVGFEISKYYLKNTKDIYKEGTSKYSGKDIYSKYQEFIDLDIYNIESNIRNEKGFGGDGTVPTRNLLLIPNDSGKVIQNPKFQSIKVSCYDDEQFQEKGYELQKIENQLTKKLGEKGLELCSHTKMPILTAIPIFEEISGKKIRYDIEGKISIEKEQKLLYSYLGYADYVSSYLVKSNTSTDNTTGSSSYGKGSVNKSDNLTVSEYRTSGIRNNTKLESRFSEFAYNNLFKSDDEIKAFIKDKNNDDVSRISLDFSGKVEGINSLLRYEILSPINVIIEDEQGRKIGIDPDTGRIINEIPGAWTSGDTEGSGEPEFFLIPRAGTGQILHKIYSYPTGEGKYHIVMNEIKTPLNSALSGGKEPQGKNIELIIAGVAEIGVEEKYIVGIKGNKAGYKKVPIDTLSDIELYEKYGEILEKVYVILDEKYNNKQKEKLKNTLIKFQSLKSNKFKDNEQINYLIRKIIEYLD